MQTPEAWPKNQKVKSGNIEKGPAVCSEAYFLRRKKHLELMHPLTTSFFTFIKKMILWVAGDKFVLWQLLYPTWNLGTHVLIPALCVCMCVYLLPCHHTFIYPFFCLFNHTKMLRKKIFGLLLHDMSWLLVNLLYSLKILLRVHIYLFLSFFFYCCIPLDLSFCHGFLRNHILPYYTNMDSCVMPETMNFLVLFVPFFIHCNYTPAHDRSRILRLHVSHLCVHLFIICLSCFK